MDWLGTLDKARNTVMTGGLKAIERVLGSAPLLGTPLPRPVSPTADPVLLVGGWANHDGSWASWMRSLARDGVRAFPVTVPGNAMGDLRDGARFVAQEIDRIKALTGAKRVDVVGFSAGGLIVREAARTHAARDSIDAVITLATPNQGLGINPAGLSRFVDPALRVVAGTSSAQMRYGSEFLTALNRPGAPNSAGPNVRFGSVYSAYIDGAVPGFRATIPGARNIGIKTEKNLLGMPIGPDHYSILTRSNAAYDAVRGMMLAQ